MSEELEHVDDHVDDALSKLPQQFKGKENFAAFITAFVNVFQDAEDMLIDLWQSRWLDNATGEQLDGLGQIVGESRGGLSDNDYRLRIKTRIRINRSTGTADDIIEMMAIVLADTTPPVELIEIFPAGLLVKSNEYVSFDIDVLASLVRDTRAAGVNTQLWYHPQAVAEAFRTSAAAAPVTESATGFASVAALGQGWINRTFGVSNYVSKVAYGAGMYVAIAGSTMKYSTDLVTWTTIAGHGFTGSIVDLTYAGGQFVAIGDASGTYRSSTSANGITFTLRNSVGAVTGGASWGAGIAYGAVGVNSHYVIISTLGDVSYSLDGITWTNAGRQLNDGSNVYALAYVGDRFLGGSEGGTFWESSDGGASWVTPGAATLAGSVHGFAKMGANYIAFGALGELFTWSGIVGAFTGLTSRTSQFGSDTIRASYNDGTTLVLVGGGGKISTSTNGTAYTARGPVGSAELRGVVKGGGVWIAAGDAGALARSTDAATWVDHTFTGTDFGAAQSDQGAETCVDYLGSAFVAWGGTPGSASRITTSQNLVGLYGGKLTGVIET